MKCKCPHCGTKFKMVTKKIISLGKNAKHLESDVEEALFVAPLPTIPAKVKAPAKVKKFRTDTDVGTFRQALYNCGFAAAADQIIFNDKNTDSRRLKLWFAGDVLNASAARKEQLMEELNALFGDRLLMCGSYNQKCGWRPNRVSYIVRLAL